jgi:hypothetical protein
MAKHEKGEPKELVRRYGKEVAAVEQYWHLAKRPKSRKPPKNYKYVEELERRYAEGKAGEVPGVCGRDGSTGG